MCFSLFCRYILQATESVCSQWIEIEELQKGANMSISGVGGSMGSYNYTYNTQSSPQKADFRKIFEEEKAEFYEKYKNGEAKPSYQIGGSSFTEEDWDKLIEGVDELTEEMRELIREEYMKRFEREEFDRQVQAKKEQEVVNI